MSNLFAGSISRGSSQVSARGANEPKESLNVNGKSLSGESEGSKVSGNEAEVSPSTLSMIQDVGEKHSVNYSMSKIS